MRRILACLLLCAVCVPALVLGQAPQTLHYQGYLTSSTGVPVNVATPITFKLYAAASGGSPLWSEPHASVSVTNGNYQVILGNSTPFGLQFNSPYWLGVTVGANAEMSPRQALTMVPYAYRAVTADTVAASATIQGSQITGTVANAVIPGVARWASATGTSQLMAPNTAYLVDAQFQFSTVDFTLPASPAVGDVVKVAAVQGTAGWRVLPNTGQTIAGAGFGFVPGLAWTARESVRSWFSVASSADGTRLVAGGEGQFLYVSTDSGVTWTPSASAGTWYSVASSADGMKLVAASFSGQLHTSTNGGTSWTPRDVNRAWYRVASSADGVKLVAAVLSGLLYTSDDSGVTWTPRESARTWRGLASSADGTKLVAAVTGGQIYVSSDSGVNWAPQESARQWWSAASSADGTKLVAVARNGQIYTSIDSGQIWTPRESSRLWFGVASSSDGARLAAVAEGGRIYNSLDGGVSWVPSESTRSWTAIASSSDGMKLAAVAYIGQAYTGFTAVRLLGGENATAELVYLGGSRWLLTNQQGSVGVQ